MRNVNILNINAMSTFQVVGWDMEEGFGFLEDWMVPESGKRPLKLRLKPAMC